MWGYIVKETGGKKLMDSSSKEKSKKFHLENKNLPIDTFSQMEMIFTTHGLKDFDR